jgi:DNA-binding Xre family transcriptional regulator
MKGMPVRIALKHYLDTIAYEEGFKPQKDRRNVPTITALADEVGITRSQMHRILSSEVKSLNLDIADKIITVMRQRGFDMAITDIVDYRDQ